MLVIKRRKDLTDFFSPYNYLINNSVKKISSGENIKINLEKDVNFFQVKFLYFKSQKILIQKDIDVKITIGSCLNNYLILLVIPFITINFFLMSFTEYDLLYFYEISKYLALFYFGSLIYFSTFGYKKYISLEIEYL